MSGGRDNNQSASQRNSPNLPAIGGEIDESEETWWNEYIEQDRFSPRHQSPQYQPRAGSSRPSGSQYQDRPSTSPRPSPLGYAPASSRPRASPGRVAPSNVQGGPQVEEYGIDPRLFESMLSQEVDQGHWQTKGVQSFQSPQSRQGWFHPAPQATYPPSHEKTQASSLMPRPDQLQGDTEMVDDEGVTGNMTARRRERQRHRTGYERDQDEARRRNMPVTAVVNERRARKMTVTHGISMDDAWSRIEAGEKARVEKQRDKRRAGEQANSSSCRYCYGKKVECDTARPQCGTCVGKGLECHYGPEPGGSGPGGRPGGGPGLGGPGLGGFEPGGSGSGVGNVQGQMQSQSPMMNFGQQQQGSAYHQGYQAKDQMSAGDKTAVGNTTQKNNKLASLNTALPHPSADKSAAPSPTTPETPTRQPEGAP